METIQDLEKAVDKLIFLTTEKLNALKQVKLAMNADILKTNGEASSISPIIRNSESNENPKDPIYKSKKNMVDKIEYLIIREGRALKNSEITNLISQEEGPKVVKKMRTAIYTHISNLVLNGKAVRCMFNNDKKLSFYVKSDWIDNSNEIRTIKDQYYPSPESLAGIEPERLKPENIIWSDKPITNLNNSDE